MKEIWSLFLLAYLMCFGSAECFLKGFYNSRFMFFQSCLYFNWFVSSGFIDSTGTVFLWNSVNNFSVFLFEVHTLNTKNPQTNIKTSFAHICLLKAQQAALLALVHKSQLYSLGQTKIETLESLKVHRCGQGWKTLRLSCPDIWKNTKQVTWV